MSAAAKNMSAMVAVVSLSLVFAPDFSVIAI
jgi:hypothetical protein